MKTPLETLIESATPLPWTFNGEDKIHGGRLSRRIGEPIVAKILNSERLTSKQERANAKLICHALKHFIELIDALKESSALNDNVISEVSDETRAFFSEWRRVKKQVQEILFRVENVREN